MPLSPFLESSRRASRARPLRRLLRDLSSVMIISGLLLVLDAAVTLVWQEPLTAVVAMIRRGDVDTRLLSLRTAPLSRADRHVLHALPNTGQRLAFLARREQRQARAGDAIGRLIIARMHASYTVVQGDDDASLQKGPGHYPQTAFPGLGATVAIAGHRTTYLAPFRHLDALAPGDAIVLQMPYGRFTYVVQFRRIVAPTALWVIRNVRYERLVLSACNPLYSAAQRIIVFARLRSASLTPGA